MQKVAALHAECRGRRQVRGKAASVGEAVSAGLGTSGNASAPGDLQLLGLRSHLRSLPLSRRAWTLSKASVAPLHKLKFGGVDCERRAARGLGVGAE
mmetsp:Transcript_39198/g.90911  ORF Transcript_39198/g.90911 Transcript_39198/m.90911 type:complete len:97 (-) Transcript_39198:1505-1795(-)